MRDIQIPIPTGSFVEAQMIPRSDLMKMVEAGDLTKIDEIRNVVRNKNIFTDRVGKVFVDYSSDRALILNNVDDFQRISRNAQHDFVGLIYDKKQDRFSISYDIDPSYTDELIKLKKNDISAQYKDLYYHFDGQRQVAQEYITIELQNGSILKYFHRTETLKQGTWVPKLADFEYLFKNKYV